jgi:signal transduction histidine kinase
MARQKFITILVFLSFTLAVEAQATQGKTKHYSDLVESTPLKVSVKNQQIGQLSKQTKEIEDDEWQQIYLNRFSITDRFSMTDSEVEKKLSIVLLKRENEINRLQMAQQDATSKNQRTILVFSMGTLGVVLLLIIQLLVNLHNKKRLNNQLKAQNDVINAMNDNLERLVRERTEKLEKTLHDLYLSKQTLTQFSYSISHNLRGPVARIMGLSMLYNQNNPADPKNTEIMKHMHTSIQGLEEVVNDLTKIIEMDYKRIPYQKVELAEELNLVLQSLSTEIEQSNAAIKSEFKSESVISVKAYINSILYNLISNAIKYRSERSLIIHIESFVKEGVFYLIVSDNGLGIDLSYDGGRKIFEFYQRGYTHVKGKGLGLYLVKTQAQSLGGEIAVESELNIGTKFIIALPLDAKIAEAKRDASQKLF